MFHLSSLAPCEAEHPQRQTTIRRATPSSQRQTSARLPFAQQHTRIPVNPTASVLRLRCRLKTHALHNILDSSYITLSSRWLLPGKSSQFAHHLPQPAIVGAMGQQGDGH